MKARMRGAPIDINQPSSCGDFELVVRAVDGSSLPGSVNWNN